MGGAASCGWFAAMYSAASRPVLLAAAAAAASSACSAYLHQQLYIQAAMQGKPAMTRSVLQREEVAADGSQQDDGEDELAAYLARIDATFGCCE